MTYRLGIDVGSTHTSWATIAGGADGTVDSGTIESALGVTADGQLVGGDALAGSSTVVRDFVPRLGDSAPVMVGATPYGAETLVSRLVSTVLDTVRARQGGDPLAVVMVHDDGLDQYRAGQLSEAARLAGVPTAATVLLPRGQAAAGGASAAAGAAKAGWTHVPDPIAAAAGGGMAMGVAGGAAAAATGVGAAAFLAEGGAATASAAAPGIAGPAGTPIAPAGPAGTPLSPAGPAGTPLQPAGPTGTPIQPAGPTGTPLQPPAAGPGGTPLQPPTAGPAGSPLPGAAPATPNVPVTAGIGAAKAASKVPRWVMVAAGGAAVVAVGVGIFLVTKNDDPPATLGNAGVVVEATDANGNAVTVPGGGAPGATDTTVAGGGGSQEFDLTPILGKWMQPCEPFLAGDGASQGWMDVTSPGTNQLSFEVGGGDTTSADCSGGPSNDITVTYPFTVVGAGESGGVQAYLVQSAGDPTCVSVEPDACGLAMGVAGPTPTAIGVDASGQLVMSLEPVSGGALPTSWEPFVEGSVRI